MALPTLRPYYQAYRPQTRAEGRIVHRRVLEEDVKQKWAENLKYFNISNVRASKQETWTSSKSFQESMDAYHKRGAVEEKRQRLLLRRERLKSLLDKENMEYEMELKSRSPSQLATMKERADYLKTQREKERKVIADEKLYEHWRSNCPKLREVESRELEKHVVGEWGKQKERKEQEQRTARKEKERYEQALEQERLAALKLEEEEQERQKREHKEHGEMLQFQMKEIKKREKEAVMLEHQQAKLIQEQVELQKAEDSRKVMEEKRKKSDLRRFLAHQCKAQLRRRSQQIQESLELDLAILEDLTEKEKENHMLQTARRERARADAVLMKEVVAKQLEIERQREYELDIMYREEAAKLWQKREAEWEKERLAREKLMKEVLEERQIQINTKMEVLKEEQGRSIQERERLIEELELEVKREEVEATARHRQSQIMARDWQHQIKEKNQEAEMEHNRYQRELEEQREAEAIYLDQLQAEEEMITTRGYTPKVFSRKKIAWT